MNGRGYAVVVALLMVCLAAPEGIQAAGSVSVTERPTTSCDTCRYAFTWVSDAAGAVNVVSSPLTFTAGDIVRIEIIPNGGGTQPSNAFDVEIRDEHGVDILNGVGADRSNTAATLILGPVLRTTASEVFSLVITNAGNAKGGTLKIWVAR